MAADKAPFGLFAKFDESSTLSAAQTSAFLSSLRARYESLGQLSGFHSSLGTQSYSLPCSYASTKSLDPASPWPYYDSWSMSKLCDLSALAKYSQFHSGGACVQDCKYCATLTNLDRAAFYWSLMAMHGLSKYPQTGQSRLSDISCASRSPSQSVSSESQPPSPSNSMDDDMNKDTSVKYQCNVCQKCYSHPRLLNRHMQSHTPYKKHHCPRCGKGFNDAFDLKRHIRTHTGVKPFKCSMCEKAFTQRCSLEAHSTRVHGVTHKFAFRERRPKVFVCEDCGQTFHENNKFRQHAKEHSNFLGGQIIKYK